MKPKAVQVEAAKGMVAVPVAGPDGASRDNVGIPNHRAAKLSELDLRMVRAVPPGGNWKNIPESIPSERLKQIRVSFANGEGSRSTYYGRLRPNAPAYTINTYFARPGNGCHVHYDYEGGQHRTISQREAARLQSFPDSFVFLGNRGSIDKQIGNAVPPLLGYLIAQRLGSPGRFVDLFCGAGGLGLGFVWAGWKPIVASDIEESFLATYRRNIHDKAVCGDIRDRAVIDAIVGAAKGARAQEPKSPLIVIGGPPCQGFSTAGNRRSVEDDRNWLFLQYKEVLQAIRPDSFVFENVTGLLNMEGGRFFQRVREELESTTKHLSCWKLQAEQYGIPQRRTRVVLLGDQKRAHREPPEPLTALEGQSDLFGMLPRAITALEALSDLPPLQPGEDGSATRYRDEPDHPYKLLMRSRIMAAEYVRWLCSMRNPHHSSSSPALART